MLKEVFTYGGKNPFTAAKVKNMIEVHQQESGKNLFTVYYGLQVKPQLTYEEACMEIGSCVLHLACCNSKAINTGS